MAHMKSYLSITVVLLTLMLFLSACKKNEAEFIMNEFSGSVTFSAEGMEYEGDFVMKNKAEMTFTVRKPEIINGCKFTFSNGETTLSFDGVTAGVLNSSPVKALFEAIEILAETPHRTSENGNILFSESEVSINFDAVADIREMKIISVSTGDADYIFG